MSEMSYDTTRIIALHNNLKACYESIAYSIVTDNIKLVYIYLGKYCDLMVKHYDLIKLNLFNFQDVMIFDNFNIVEDINKLRKEI